jgi:hypothetical protein
VSHLKLQLAVVLFAGSAGCIQDESATARIVVSEPNHLGVTALEIEHLEQNGDKVFALHGLTDSGAEVASVRLRLGEVADFATEPDPYGAELTISADGEEWRQFSRETRKLVVMPGGSPAINTFLSLATVSTSLEREASISVVSASSQPAAGETAQYAGYCWDQLLLTTPLARQCCMTERHSGGTDEYHMWFYNSGSDRLVFRPHNGPAAAVGGCRAVDGTSTCSGETCYFGPKGFASATFSNRPAGGVWNPAVWKVGVNIDPTSYCNAGWYSGSWTPQFTNVTGVVPLGGGCCINGSGPCDQGGSTPACTSCGGGGAAGKYKWDY